MCIRDRDQIPTPDEATLAIFDQGTEVGELARQLFPGGTMVAPGIFAPDQVIAQTRQAIRERRPLYEAAFVFNGGYARTDILVPVSGDAWDLVEVKSTTDVYKRQQEYRRVILIRSHIRTPYRW